MWAAPHLCVSGGSGAPTRHSQLPYLLILRSVKHTWGVIFFADAPNRLFSCLACIKMASDPEKDVETFYVKGYPSLAAFIASDLDHSSVLYKRFNKLSARNILYLQSELAELERRQDEFDEQDLLDDDLSMKKIARNWRAFSDAAAVTGSRAEKRMELSIEIRNKIKEYSKIKLRLFRCAGPALTCELRRSHRTRLRRPLPSPTLQASVPRIPKPFHECRPQWR